MTTYLMHPITGTVDTEESWRSEMINWVAPEELKDALTPQEMFDTLIQVRLTTEAEREDNHELGEWVAV